MIDYSRLDNRDYYNSIVADINSISDERELADILKILSIKLFYKEIDPDQASLLLSTIKSRITSLKGNRASSNGGGVSKNQDKIIRLSPTSVSSRAGTISVVFLALNIAITTVMYVLLIVGKIIG